MYRKRQFQTLLIICIISTHSNTHHILWEFMARNSDGTFKEGHPGLKPKGAISEKTRVWNEISEWFKGEGIEAYQEKLMDMKDENPNEFLKRFEAMLEYFQPKLSRTELDASVKKEPEFDPTQYSEDELAELERLLEKGKG